MLEGLEARALMTFAGGLDPTFGGGAGYYLAPVAAGTGTGLTDLTSVAVEKDGSVVAAGPVGKAGSQSFGVIGLNAQGALDTSFGVAGEADVALPNGVVGTGNPPALLVQPDGKIVLVGSATVGGASPRVETVVARFTANGLADSTFGSGGVQVLDDTALGLSDASLPFGALQADGKIVLAGTGTIPSDSSNRPRVVAVRLNAGGPLDPTFGTNGVVTLSDIPANEPPSVIATEATDGVAVQPDGKVVILGQIRGLSGVPRPNTTPELIRLNADGSRDNSLGQGGITSTAISTPDANGLIVQPDGKILVIGQGTFAAFPDIIESTLGRFNADGSLDKVAILPATVGSDTTLRGFALQPDGKVAVTGVGLTPSVDNTRYFEAIRLTAALTPDDTFGEGGVSAVAVAPTKPTGGGTPPAVLTAKAVAVGPDNRIVLVGSNSYTSETSTGSTAVPATYYAAARLTSTGSAHPGDFTGDGIADPAVYLTARGSFAIRPSQGGPDRIIPFGIPGPGQTIPAPGDYTGSGAEEVAAYLPALGVYAYRPPTGPDVLVRFGIKGPGQTIPAPGDYFGTGRDDLAVYLPSLGEFGLRNPAGGPDQLIPFGIKGPGRSIPVPGDYDGSGKTELAVYLTSTGSYAYRPANGGPDVIVPFGMPGVGNSIPMPGDYDGSGKTELAVYLPSRGELIYRPANGGADVTLTVGIAGPGQSVAAQGDYTGSGRTEAGVYLPTLGDLSFRPANGGAEVRFPFGIKGPGQTIPVTTVVQSPFPGSSTTSAASVVVPGELAASGPLDLMAVAKAKKAKPGAAPLLGRP